MCGGCYFGFVFEVVLLIGMIEVYFEDYVVYECEFVFVWSDIYDVVFGCVFVGDVCSDVGGYF